MPTSRDKHFLDAYKRLNKEQKAAVDAIEGPVMVIAGPGTGKTQVLTMRIANILRETDTPPDAILALTFTESGAVAMRRRLAELIGERAYHVTITTFHGFANSVIKTRPEEFPAIVGANNISNVDEVRIMRDIIDRLPLAALKPFGDRYFYLRSVMKAIADIKKEGVSPDEFETYVAEEEAAFKTIPDLLHDSGRHEGKMKGKYADESKRIERNKELSKLYREYQKTLEKNRLYDWSDMIMEVVRALERNGDLLRTLQEEYLYMLVDEHQDTNRAQNRMIELLADYYDEPNLFVVGDEKQAIFRFQGASLENFLYFKERYKNVKLVTLRENYRSTQAILDAAHGLAPEKEPLASNVSYPNEKIMKYAFTEPEVENYFVASRAKALIGGGVPPHEIAVLYRENRDAAPVARMMEKLGVPFLIESDQNVLGDEDIKKLLKILKAVRHFGRDTELAEALHVDLFGIPPLDAYKMFAFAAKNRVRLADVLRSEALRSEAGVEAGEKIQALFDGFSRWKHAAENKGAARAFEDIVRESGFLAHILKGPSAVEKLGKVHALFDEIKAQTEAKKDYSLNDFFEYLEVVEAHDVLIRGAHVDPHGLVRLMTAHRAKGLEFAHVFIVAASDGRWGGRRRSEHIGLPPKIFNMLQKAEESIEGASDADERNLFYVALTRAKETATITYPERSASGREQLPSRFIGEILEGRIETKSGEEIESEFRARREIEFAPATAREGGGATKEHKEFLNRRFKEQGLSATALNNYLACPWQYFYRNLIRIPEAPNKHLMYGNAVHAALERFFSAFREGKSPRKQFLTDRFKEALSREPIEQSDYDEALAKGERALNGYFDAYRASWTPNILTEFSVRDIPVGEITVNGKIDKMELGAGNAVNVTDYKTGQPRTRNDIEGKTASSGGEYKRQLVFYKLLLDRFENGKYRMETGEIDFVEPDKKGKYHKEKFEITAGEVKVLVSQIEAVTEEILNLSFWDKTCGDKECRYCALRALMA